MEGIERMEQADHDLLIRIDTRMMDLMNDMRRMNDTVHPGFESRLRALENFRWWVLGACAVLSLAGSLLGSLILHR